MGISYSTRVNKAIRSKEVRTIDQDGKQAGVISIDEALKLAENAGLDLVEVAPEAKPPVCRIMDFGKYRYEQSKKDKEAKKKQHVIKMKEVKLRPNIEEHDYSVKLKRAQDFLNKGCKVKITMMFRGREITHMDIGRKILARLTKDLEGVGTVDAPGKVMGRILVMTLTAAKQKTKT